MDLVGADPGAWERIAARSSIAVLKTGPHTPAAANILKQCMLSAGADAIVARGCIDASADCSMAVLYGTPKSLAAAARSLEGQPFGLDALSREIPALLAGPEPPPPLRHSRGTLPLDDGPLLMGILNVTPDSFSDGGLYLDPGASTDHALEMISRGASIIDIGAESTRPGSLPVPPGVQIARALPVLGAVLEREPGALISIDTTSPEVAEAALEAGAVMVNDISALGSPGMAGVVARSGAALVLMHMKGTPRDMQESPWYGDVVGEVYEFLRSRVEAAMDAGIPRDRLLADPGIGFGKRLEDNISLISRLAEFRGLGCGVLAGFSRKRFTGTVTGVEDPAGRDPAAHALAALAVRDADVLRVHDVAGALQAVRIAKAVDGGGGRA